MAGMSGQERPFIVLTVEDDLTYQELVSQITRLTGVSCSFVASGAEAIEAIDDVQPELLLIDYYLGDMTATELIAKLQSEGKGLPFIIMTGNGNEEMAVEMMKKGAVDYVIKDQSFLKRLSVALKSAKTALRMEQQLATTQRELQTHRDHFANFIEQSRDLIVLLDKQTRIRRINPAFESATGLTSDVLGIFYKETLMAESHTAFDNMLKKEKAQQQADPIEVQIRDASNQAIPVEIILTPLPYESEIEYLVLGRDLREHKKLEEQLRQSQKMQAVGRLAGGVAHDFNNILTTIIGFSELISDAAPKDSEISEYIGEIKQASNRATALTNQLLLFSRRQVMEPRVLHLNGFLTEVRRMLERLLTEDIKLMFDLASELMAVKVDHGQLTQVALNLVVNARDAMPYGGQLKVRTYNVMAENVPHITETPSEWYVCLQVSDTGVGMSEEVRKQIFEPFFTTKEVGKGTGLGLAVVYSIISQHNGFIDVDSDEGFGSTFRVYLPAVHRMRKVDGQDVLPARTALQGKGQKILVVEDEPRVRTITQKILTRNNYRVVTANGINDAVAVLDQPDNRIDLVVIDVVLGDGSGLDLARMVKTINSDCPVLLTSGYTSEKSQFEEIQAEGFPFLKKPYSAIELMTAVSDAF